MFELIATALILAALGSLFVFGVLCWVATLPFHLLGFLFHAAGFLVAIPFLILAGILVVVGLVFAALLFVVPMILLPLLLPLLPVALVFWFVWWLVHRRKATASA